jgi:hypothetical protein
MLVCSELLVICPTDCPILLLTLANTGASAGLRSGMAPALRAEQWEVTRGAGIPLLQGELADATGYPLSSPVLGQANPGERTGAILVRAPLRARSRGDSREITDNGGQSLTDRA